jgi:hypothetical protein
MCIRNYILKDPEMVQCRDSKLNAKRMLTEKIMEKSIVKIGTINVQLQNLFYLADMEWLNNEVVMPSMIY